MSDALFLKNYVDNLFCIGMATDSDDASTNLSRVLREEFTDDRLEKMIMTSGWIPDLYANDSSEETLYSKMIEVLVAEWAKRIGGTGEYIKIKADHEDVKITIADSTIVCDAKSFRLSRSQRAPNPKDMVKPDAFKEWRNRHEISVGGLVTYPSTHDWVRGSVVYRDCSNKENPILILSYRHLALLLHYKDRYQAQGLLGLWDYETLFPTPLSSKTNRADYWRVINNTICTILSISAEDFNSYMENCDNEIKKAVKDYRDLILAARKCKIDKIKEEVETEDIETIRQRIIAWRIKNEASDYDIFIDRIDAFR